LARRARVLLLLADGRSLTEAARIAGLTIRNARKWVHRFLALGIDGLHDQAGRGRKPVFSPLGRVASG
jgi:transposase